MLQMYLKFIFKVHGLGEGTLKDTKSFINIHKN
jgi:hypothetical protein